MLGCAVGKRNREGGGWDEVLVSGRKRKGPHFDDDKTGAAVVGAFEVDGALVVRDVEAFDCVSFLEVFGRGCGYKGEGEKNGENRELHGGW